LNGALDPLPEIVGAATLFVREFVDIDPASHPELPVTLADIMQYENRVARLDFDRLGSRPDGGGPSNHSATQFRCHYYSSDAKHLLPATHAEGASGTVVSIGKDVGVGFDRPGAVGTALKRASTMALIGQGRLGWGWTLPGGGHQHSHGYDLKH
jgi:hypothetical protein